MKKIYICTTNENKLREYKQLFNKLNLSNFELYSIRDLGLVEPDEDEDSLLKNAIHKAKEYRKQLIRKDIEFDYVLAEDFGFIVNDYPEITDSGVKSKRLFECVGAGSYSDYEDTDDGRNQYLIDYFSGLGCMYASYICIIGKKDPENNKIMGIGYTEGKISNYQKGENGFAFDKILELPSGNTIAELSDDEKNEISSRKEALQSIIKNKTILK